MDKNIIYRDVAIIGAGPVGLFTVFELGMLNLSSCLIDSLDAIGGQCSALYPEKPIYDIPAYPKIMAAELIDRLSEQMQPFHPEILLSNKVNSINDINFLHNNETYKFELITNKKNVIRSKAVIIALGGGAFGPIRPGLEDIEYYEGKSVFYAVQNKEIFRNQNIMIAGGGDSAIDWALNLHSIANKIYVIHRREKFRCAPESLRQLQEISIGTNKKVEFTIPYQLNQLKGNKSEGKLSEIEIIDLEDNKRSFLVDKLLCFFGLSNDIGEVNNWGVDLATNGKSIIVDSSTMQTKRNGIYGVGDVVYYSGKLKLILTGFAEAALASHSVYKFIYPEKHLHFEHSTSRGVNSKF